MLRTRVFTVLATAAVLGSGCAPEGAPPETAAPVMSWEEFRASVYRHPDTGVFVTNGDETYPTEALLREYYETYVRQPGPGRTQQGLVVMYRNGAPARWSDTLKRKITYCVSTAFGSRHAEVVTAMRGAASEWESAADLRFVHRPEYDGTCDASQGGVLFDVRPDTALGDSTWAVAFYPDDPRALRSVRVGNASFSPSNPAGLTLRGILLHELGHALGFRHEHIRPEGSRQGICGEGGSWLELTAYDRDSVMHARDPQCNNGNTSYVLTLSALDRVGVALHYGARHRQLDPDFDGDGRADRGVWQRPVGEWYLLLSSGSGAQYTWGRDGDRLVPADYNGDRRTDLGVWRPSDGTWHVLDGVTRTALYNNFGWGLTNDVPAPGDYDGDGRADLAVWRPSSGNWYILYSDGGTLNGVQWGVNGDIPVPADYDGDGRTDRAVWRPSNGGWYILPTGAPGTQVAVAWGVQGDVPLPGDYDGDGRADRALWRASTGYWYIQFSGGGSAMNGEQWGLPGDTPVPADYDGDKRVDRAVWRPGNGTWYVRPSTAPGTSVETVWGSAASGDMPVRVYR